jgi:hypothetical protein
MTRERIQKVKSRRRRAAHGEPLEATWARPSRGARLVESIEDLIEDIERALEETGGWPG